MPSLPPCDTLSAAADAPTAFSSIPTTLTNENSWLRSISTRALGFVLPPLIVSVTSPQSMSFLVAHWLATDVAATESGSSWAAARAMLSAAFCRSRRSLA